LDVVLWRLLGRLLLALLLSPLGWLVGALLALARLRGARLSALRRLLGVLLALLLVLLLVLWYWPRLAGLHGVRLLIRRWLGRLFAAVHALFELVVDDHAFGGLFGIDAAVGALAVVSGSFWVCHRECMIVRV